MKLQESQEKKFRQLSDEELKQVTGGSSVGMECKPKPAGKSCAEVGWPTVDGDQCCRTIGGYR